MEEATHFKDLGVLGNTQSESLSNAIKSWRTLLGSKNVIDSPDSLQPYLASCAEFKSEIKATIKPTSVSQVSAALKIAMEFKIPVYPISRGCNWGYGSTLPSHSGSVVMDLSQMNRIVEYNSELAYVVVEPGVTQGELHKFLLDQGHDLVGDVTGSSPNASLIGNLLERGFGLTGYADHFLNSASYEVVLADGSVIKTGFGHYKNCASKALYKWGVGPSLDGLFSQSNFGIITQATIWLYRAPESLGVLSCGFATDQEFLEAVSALRELRLNGSLRTAVHIANDVRVISSFQQYPYEETKGATPLPQETLLQLRNRWKVGAWNIVASLSGTKDQIKADLKEIKRLLKGKCTVRFLYEDTVKFFAKLPWLYRLLMGHDLKPKQNLFRLLAGEPNEGPLLGSYWRMKKVAPKSDRNPARDGCGLLWCSPVVPTTPGDIGNFLAITRRLMRDFQFETNITITLRAERSCCCTVAIVFDASDPQEVRRAQDAHEVLLKSYVNNGYIPYRLGSNPAENAQLASQSDFEYEKLLKNLKEKLDPYSILAPGRYGIS